MKKKISRILGLLMILPIMPFGIFGTVLSADQDVARKEDVLTQYPVTSGEIIYKGAMVCVDTDGYLLAAADTAGYKFAGIAYEQKDNSSGLDAALSCRVYTKGVFLLTCTSIMQSMVGNLLYVTDDDVVDESSTNDIVAGRLVKYVSATQGWVDIGDRVRGNSETLYVATGGVIDFAAGNFTITHSAGLLTFSGAVTVSGAMILSSTLAVTGAVTLSSHLNLGDYDMINFGADPDVGMRWHGTGGYFHIFPYVTDKEFQLGQVGLVMHQRILTTGEMRFRDDGLYIYSSTDGRLDIVSDQYIWLTPGANYGVQIEGSCRMTGINKLFLRDAGIWINSGADGRLDLVTDGTAYNAIQITGNINLSTGYLKLFVTDADGSTEGQLWYDNSENLLKYFGATTQTVVVEESSNAFTAANYYTGATKLYFRDAGTWINSGAQGRLDIITDGVTHNAIQITTGGGASGIKLYAMLGLNVTTTIGDTKGQIWYDATSNKIHFWNGTAEQEVTSGGA